MNKPTGDKNANYLLSKGWENTGGVTPFWRHDEITKGRLTYKYHAIYYQEQIDRAKPHE